MPVFLRPASRPVGPAYTHPPGRSATSHSRGRVRRSWPRYGPTAAASCTGACFEVGLECLSSPTTARLAACPRTAAGSSCKPFDMREFAVVSTRSLAVSKMISLHGMSLFDAVSPDASTLFLVQYSGTGPNVAYRIRAYDVTQNRLLPGAIVDRLEEEADMRGQPVTRATSPDGRWAYTLYARARHEPFVHALDTVRRAAYCVDLPLEMRLSRQMALRLSVVQSGRVLAVRAGDRTMASMNTKTFEVRTGG